MAYVEYSGPAGQFIYDSDFFTVSTTTGLLSYIGSERQGENIDLQKLIAVNYTRGNGEIVHGHLLSCEGMFKNTMIQTPPRIPEGVVNVENMFYGCRQLTKMPVFPSSVVYRNNVLGGISMDEAHLGKEQDQVTSYIEKEISNEIDKYYDIYNKEIAAIEKAYSYNSISSEKADKKIINAELKARLSICEAQKEGLKKAQNHLNKQIDDAIKMGAPSDYMKDNMRIKELQIEQIDKEMTNIRQELRYRNPTVLDIAKSAAIDTKEKLVSLSQKTAEKIINKAQEISYGISKGIGNVYRASELAEKKINYHILQAYRKINEKDINITAKAYEKVLNGVCKLSVKLNAAKESLKAFKASIENKEYTTVPGMTEGGKKIVEQMYDSFATELKYKELLNFEAENLKLKINELSNNLSPTEQKTAEQLQKDMERNIQVITNEARDAAQEKIASYQKTADYKDIDAGDIAERYPKSVKIAMSISPDTRFQNVADERSQSQMATFMKGYLYNEVAPADVMDKGEFSEKLEEVMNNIQNYKSDYARDIIERAEAQGVHVKEDHAEVLSASVTGPEQIVSGGKNAQIRDVFGGEMPDFSNVTPPKEGGDISSSQLAMSAKEKMSQNMNDREGFIDLDKQQVDISR